MIWLYLLEKAIKNSKIASFLEFDCEILESIYLYIDIINIMP